MDAVTRLHRTLWRECANIFLQIVSESVLCVYVISLNPTTPWFEFVRRCGAVVPEVAALMLLFTGSYSLKWHVTSELYHATVHISYTHYTCSSFQTHNFLLKVKSLWIDNNGIKCGHPSLNSSPYNVMVMYNSIVIMSPPAGEPCWMGPLCVQRRFSLYDCVIISPTYNCVCYFNITYSMIPV
jgi:hypothetical protein